MRLARALQPVCSESMRCCQLTLGGHACLGLSVSCTTIEVGCMLHPLTCCAHGPSCCREGLPVQLHVILSICEGAKQVAAPACRAEWTCRMLHDCITAFDLPLAKQRSCSLVQMHARSHGKLWQVWLAISPQQLDMAAYRDMAEHSSLCLTNPIRIRDTPVLFCWKAFCTAAHHQAHAWRLVGPTYLQKNNGLQFWPGSLSGQVRASWPGTDRQPPRPALESSTAGWSAAGQSASPESAEPTADGRTGVCQAHLLDNGAVVPHAVYEQPARHSAPLRPPSAARAPPCRGL